MKYTVEVSDEAKEETLEAYVYYELQQENLGERFIDKLEEYYKRIQDNPRLYPLKSQTNREAYMQKFPYLVIYRIIEQKILIVGVFNAHQDPEKKPK